MRGHGAPARGLAGAPSLKRLRLQRAEAERAIQAYDAQARHGVERPRRFDRPLDHYKNVLWETERALRSAQGSPSAPTGDALDLGLDRGPTAYAPVTTATAPGAHAVRTAPKAVAKVRTSTEPLTGTQADAAVRANPSRSEYARLATTKAQERAINDAASGAARTSAAPRRRLSPDHPSYDPSLDFATAYGAVPTPEAKAQRVMNEKAARGRYGRGPDDLTQSMSIVSRLVQSASRGAATGIAYGAGMNAPEDVRAGLVDAVQGNPALTNAPLFIPGIGQVLGGVSLAGSLLGAGATALDDSSRAGEVLGGIRDGLIDSVNPFGDTRSNERTGKRQPMTYADRLFALANAAALLMHPAAKGMRAVDRLGGTEIASRVADAAGSVGLNPGSRNIDTPSLRTLRERGIGAQPDPATNPYNGAGAAHGKDVTEPVGSGPHGPRPRRGAQGADPQESPVAYRRRDPGIPGRQLGPDAPPHVAVHTPEPAEVARAAGGERIGSGKVRTPSRQAGAFFLPKPKGRNAGKALSIGDASDIKAVADDVWNGRDVDPSTGKRLNTKGQKTVFAASVSPETIDVLDHLGVPDAEKFGHAFDLDPIRHVYDRHTNPKIELSRGARPVTPDDLARLPDLVDKPDVVYTDGTKTQLGADLIYFAKKVTDSMGLDEHYLVSSAIHDGKHRLLNLMSLRVETPSKFAQTLKEAVGKGAYTVQHGQARSLNTRQRSKRTATHPLPATTRDVGDSSLDRPKGPKLQGDASGSESRRGGSEAARGRRGGRRARGGVLRERPRQEPAGGGRPLGGDAGGALRRGKGDQGRDARRPRGGEAPRVPRRRRAHARRNGDDRPGRGTLPFAGCAPAPPSPPGGRGASARAAGGRAPSVRGGQREDLRRPRRRDAQPGLDPGGDRDGDGREGQGGSGSDGELDLLQADAQARRAAPASVRQGSSLARQGAGRRAG